MKPSGWLFIERISLECLPTALTLLTLVYQVRTIVKDGEPWFVAKDVCEYFGDTNYRRSVGRLDDDEKGVSPLDTPGGTQEMAIVCEAGLYSLILSSRKPEAKEFKRWITHEVIPSIRQHGIYAVDTVISAICRYLAFLRWNNPHILTESSNISQDKKDSTRQQRSNIYL